VGRCPRGCDSKPYIHGCYGKQSTPRFKCPQCKKTFSPRTLKPCADLNISTDTIYRILTCLTEGTGIRATAKINDVHPATVLRVLKVASKRAAMILAHELRNVKASHIAIDECWTFLQKKQARVTPEDHPDFGD
jgi:transposase-like protein